MSGTVFVTADFFQGLSKKELKETKRENARLLADQRISIPRVAETKHMPISKFLTTVA